MSGHMLRKRFDGALQRQGCICACAGMEALGAFPHPQLVEWGSGDPMAQPQRPSFWGQREAPHNPLSCLDTSSQSGGSALHPQTPPTRLNCPQAQGWSRSWPGPQKPPLPFRQLGTTPSLPPPSGPDPGGGWTGRRVAEASIPTVSVPPPQPVPPSSSHREGHIPQGILTTPQRRPPDSSFLGAPVEGRGTPARGVPPKVSRGSAGGLASGDVPEKEARGE